ncbi:hypothetical protein EBN88_10630 [Streptomyces triticirhizae]|uniref:Uncharacterized protein n=1 Tax=Streptomyces triticirhizae TaxID=2483353 RepID=A0A3M2LW76_9ACTN|nr:hypothetical protein EBN88_10630 [Streptomyces triticirhizae]
MVPDETLEEELGETPEEGLDDGPEEALGEALGKRPEASQRSRDPAAGGGGVVPWREVARREQGHERNPLSRGLAPGQETAGTGQPRQTSGGGGRQSDGTVTESQKIHGPNRTARH